MKRKMIIIGAIVLALGLAWGAFLLWGPRTLTLTVNGTQYPFRSSARLVYQILDQAGLHPLPQDSVAPALTTRLRRGEGIILEQAVWVQFWEDGALQSEILSPSRQPVALLAAGQMLMDAADELRLNGVVIDLTQPLPRAPFYVFEIRRAVDFTITVDGAAIQMQTTASTIAEALQEARVQYTSVDELSAPLTASPAEYPAVTLRRARLVTIEADGRSINAWTAAETVSGALADAGLVLSALDRSLPSAEENLPTDGRIRVLRIREEVLLEQSYVPYGRSLQPDPELPLDQRNVISPGQTGIEVTRTRVTYVDGIESTRTAEASWTASDPQDEVLGYGQQVNTASLDTEYGALSYYRSVTMYATSYRPCAFSDGCHYSTRGGCTLQKGVVAVAGSWYASMAGQQVYIPGYGKATICDSGGGIPGRYWIDLGFSDDDYEGWYHWVTVYFLTPVPDTILWILP